MSLEWRMGVGREQVCFGVLITIKCEKVKQSITCTYLSIMIAWQRQMPPLAARVSSEEKRKKRRLYVPDLCRDHFLVGEIVFIPRVMYTWIFYTVAWNNCVDIYTLYERLVHFNDARTNHTSSCQLSSSCVTEQSLKWRHFVATDCPKVKDVSASHTTARLSATMHDNESLVLHPHTNSGSNLA